MKICLLFILLMSSSVFAQDKMVKKLERELGHELVPVDPDYSKKIDSTQLEVIWSRTVDSVVIGRSYRGEYISQLDTQEREAILYPTFITDFISKNDFLAFRSWILDSIARDLLIEYSMNHLDDKFQWIQLSEEEKEEHHEAMKKPQYGPHGEYISYSIKNPIQNTSKVVHFNSFINIPALSEMYLPEPSRFRNKKSFDYRKVFFQFDSNLNGYKGSIPVIVDSYQWAKKSTHPFDVGAVMSYLNDQILLEPPITHINPPMAKVYCQWRELQLNKQFNDSKYTIRCRLPTIYEIENEPLEPASFTLKTYDHTKDWQVTNEEYHAFCAATLDSVCREYLFFNEKDDELANSLLAYRDYYFSPSNLEYLKFDPTTRQINRELFPWNSKRIKWKKFGFKNQEALLNKLNLDSVAFHYEWVNAQSRSILGELHAVKPPSAFRNSPWMLELSSNDSDGRGEPIGQDLGLDGYVHFSGEKIARFGQGTRTHANLQRFIEHEVLMLPLPSQIPKNDEIADITYQQALAYYNWKYRIDLYNEGDEGDWQQFVFPSEAEFERIKNGETIVHPAEEIQYDSPVFRMVIELQPKK